VAEQVRENDFERRGKLAVFGRNPMDPGRHDQSLNDLAAPED
jgi:hypothetical protein